MNTKKIWANLTVANLEQTNKFYSALGFKSNGTDVSAGLTSFSFGDDAFIINFFLKENLVENVKIEVAAPEHGHEVIFTLGAQNREEVDTWAEEVKKAGGKISSGPEVFGNNYYGFVFSDPDEHAYNVFFMEGM